MKDSTAAPLEEPKPKPHSTLPPLLPSAYDDRDDRDLGLPVDLDSDLCSPTDPF